MNEQAASDNPVLGDIAEMWAFARSAGLEQRLKALQVPNPKLSIAAALFDWLVIVVATMACFCLGLWFTPLAIVVVGNRQRALGNLLHDASHYSLHRNHSLAGWLANLLLCWPLWISMPLYRKEHSSHHNHLADPALDPDYIHSDAPVGARWTRIVAQQVFSLSMFRNAFFGHTGRAEAGVMAGSILWWVTVLASITVLFSLPQAMLFLLLWLVSRATSFHIITAIREISDHVGLQPGTLVGFSRNHVAGGLSAQLIHPHNNGYHLLHHLVPRMPYHAFPQAHALLLAWPRYAQGVHCDSYVWGQRAAIKSWCGAGEAPSPGTQ